MQCQVTDGDSQASLGPWFIAEDTAEVKAQDPATDKLVYLDFFIKSSHEFINTLNAYLLYGGMLSTADSRHKSPGDWAGHQQQPSSLRPHLTCRQPEIGEMRRCNKNFHMQHRASTADSYHNILCFSTGPHIHLGQRLTRKCQQRILLLSYCRLPTR